MKNLESRDCDYRLKKNRKFEKERLRLAGKRKESILYTLGLWPFLSKVSELLECNVAMQLKVGGGFSFIVNLLLPLFP